LLLNSKKVTFCGNNKRQGDRFLAFFILKNQDDSLFIILQDEMNHARLRCSNVSEVIPIPNNTAADTSGTAVIDNT
jgi:hypothetical protein